MGDKKRAYRVLLGRYMTERDNVEDMGISGRIILKWIFRKCDLESMGWIDLAQDWGQVFGAREGGKNLSGVS
jgi:hypothetical protein